MKKTINTLLLICGVAHCSENIIHQENICSFGTSMFKISYDSTCNDQETPEPDNFLLFGTNHCTPFYAYPDVVQQELSKAKFFITELAKIDQQAKTTNELIIDLNENVIKNPSQGEVHDSMVNLAYRVLNTHIKILYNIKLEPIDKVHPLIMSIYLKCIHSCQFYGVDNYLKKYSFHGLDGLDDCRDDLLYFETERNTLTKNSNYDDFEYKKKLHDKNTSLFLEEDYTKAKLGTYVYYGHMMIELLDLIKKNLKGRVISLKKTNERILDVIDNLDSNIAMSIFDENENINTYEYIEICIKREIMNNQNKLKISTNKLLSLLGANFFMQYIINTSHPIVYRENTEFCNLKKRNIKWLEVNLIPILFKNHSSCDPDSPRVAAFGQVHFLERDPNNPENVWGILDFFLDLQDNKRTDYWKDLIGHEKIWFDMITNVRVERLFTDGSWQSYRPPA